MARVPRPAEAAPACTSRPASCLSLPSFVSLLLGSRAPERRGRRTRATCVSGAAPGLPPAPRASCSHQDHRLKELQGLHHRGIHGADYFGPCLHLDDEEKEWGLLLRGLGNPLVAVVSGWHSS
ncbi:hypothetical protein NDU88_000862 [Pleurodeles waltl]|uniref:Uncharacterized protein n=1 Tax=Pleurodeles waltl TaxID=8319 RepID=A0AAV7U8S9_PLEWA|nr:hypothetical protein NDU88_000862 [Pleurodeles waltl]